MALIYNNLSIINQGKAVRSPLLAEAITENYFGTVAPFYIIICTFVILHLPELNFENGSHMKCQNGGIHPRLGLH